MLWVVAAATAGIWIALLAVVAAATEPRDVDPGPAMLDLPGPESAAVVGLLTGDWELHRDALTATVLDLAARRHIHIEWIAPHTFVRVPKVGTPGDDALAPYEAQVLIHLQGLAGETTDGMVPAEALTTGPELESKGWWKRFATDVTADARARGLSRPRWSAGARTLLCAWAVVVGLAVGVAASTLPQDQSSNNDDPVGAAIAFGVATTLALCFVAGRLRGERDTPAGREAAARWLGVREMLADDPTFPVQPPAAVAIWGRLMAHGAAMGLTGAAADALPLGTESERLAWSPVGNRWRPVRIRYPDLLPPGYGRHPALVAGIGAMVAVLGAVIGPAVLAAARALLDGAADYADNATVPWWARLVVGLVAGTFAAAAAVVAVAGASMLVGGIADLVRARRPVEGRVLRIRERGDDDDRYWHIAVDDGTADRIRAWRMDTRPGARQGDTVTAAVSRWLAHVKGLTVVDRHGSELAAAEAGATTGAPIAVTSAAGPAPTLPAPSAVGAVLGRPVEAAAGAAAHPLAVGGGSATYLTPDGGRIVMAWVPSQTIDALRALPRMVAPAVDGLGDEAFRAPAGGGVLARFGAHVLLVAAALPGIDADARDAVVTKAAGLVGAG